MQQPQTAEAQDEQQPQKQEKPNLIADDQVDWNELLKCGIDKEKLSEKDLKALMNYGKTGLVTVKPTLGYETYQLQARLSFQKMEDGKLKLTPHFIRNEPRLDIPHNGYTFTDEDKKNLKRTGNLGKVVDVADTRTGEMRQSYISIDRLTNEIVDVPADKVRIPYQIGQTGLTKEEMDILRAGLALPKEVTLSNGRKFQALLQVSAEKTRCGVRAGAATSAAVAASKQAAGQSRCTGADAGKRRKATAQPLVDERGRQHPPDKQMERRPVQRTANRRLRGRQDGGACQRKGRPRASPARST